MIGWIKLHRKLSEKAFYTKDSEMVHLWIQLLFRANHLGREESLGGNQSYASPDNSQQAESSWHKRRGFLKAKSKEF